MDAFQRGHPGLADVEQWRTNADFYVRGCTITVNVPGPHGTSVALSHEGVLRYAAEVRGFDWLSPVAAAAGQTAAPNGPEASVALPFLFPIRDGGLVAGSPEAAAAAAGNAPFPPPLQPHEVRAITGDRTAHRRSWVSVVVYMRCLGFAWNDERGLFAFDTPDAACQRRATAAASGPQQQAVTGRGVSRMLMSMAELGHEAKQVLAIKVFLRAMYRGGSSGGGGAENSPPPLPWVPLRASMRNFWIPAVRDAGVRAQLMAYVDAAECVVVGPATASSLGMPSSGGSTQNSTTTTSDALGIKGSTNQGSDGQASSAALLLGSNGGANNGNAAQQQLPAAGTALTSDLTPSSGILGGEGESGGGGLKSMLLSSTNETPSPPPPSGHRNAQAGPGDTNGESGGGDRVNISSGQRPVVPNGATTPAPPADPLFPPVPVPPAASRTQDFNRCVYFLDGRPIRPAADYLCTVAGGRVDGASSTLRAAVLREAEALIASDSDAAAAADSTRAEVAVVVFVPFTSTDSSPFVVDIRAQHAQAVAADVRATRVHVWVVADTFVPHAMRRRDGETTEPATIVALLRDCLVARCPAPAAAVPGATGTFGLFHDDG